jgi:hypothetical protein
MPLMVADPRDLGCVQKGAWCLVFPGRATIVLSRTVTCSVSGNGGNFVTGMTRQDDRAGLTHDHISGRALPRERCGTTYATSSKAEPSYIEGTVAGECNGGAGPRISALGSHGGATPPVLADEPFLV